MITTALLVFLLFFLNIFLIMSTNDEAEREKKNELPAACRDIFKK